MPTRISPMLAVHDGAAAIEFYKAAFGATLMWHLGGGQVAGLSIDCAPFFLAHEFRRMARARRRPPGSRPSGSSCSWTIPRGHRWLIGKVLE